MGLKREKISLKIRIFIGVFEAASLIAGLGLWDYYSEVDLQYGKYVFQGVGFAFLMSWMHKYKVVEEKK